MHPPCRLDRQEAQCFLTVRPSVCYKACEHYILKTNERTLMPIDINGPPGKYMKRSTLMVRRSKVKVTQEAVVRCGGLVESSFSTPWFLVFLI